ncbi:amino acid ABC transporter substrate-binding protein [Treponema ruminis]|uniref:Polar amino acid transport system substrate-binding protein n=1 Tax=Treponema ruminis TaxID=744515 RepID=A0A7W8G9U4_9SPIR|nr:ABC transporter substrate-binding protein [Treponema ruminis]MBB5226507.1 polar amino acid transport system substrate-binding protein [Treponema ruminis]QSI02589.1 amino acid ABC transporter substrate-binding protein [Treponema ruminis]
MKKIAIVAAVLASVVSLMGCNKKAEAGEFTVEKGKFKVGMEIGYPPMEYFDADGKTPMGFDVEFGKALSEKLGLEVEFIDTAWDGIFAGLETNKYDVVIAAATITPERLESMEFSKPYVGNGQTIVVNAASGYRPVSPKELEGKTVAYQAETTSDIFMEKQAKAGLKFTPAEFDKVLNAYDELKLGRCDAVVSDALVFANYADDPSYVSTWVGDADEYFGVAIRKGNSVLLDKVNAAIDEMKADGTLKKLYLKIFGSDLSDTVK